jgi:hypothetical protein
MLTSDVRNVNVGMSKAKAIEVLTEALQQARDAEGDGSFEFVVDVVPNGSSHALGTLTFSNDDMEHPDNADRVIVDFDD